MDVFILFFHFFLYSKHTSNVRRPNFFGMILYFFVFWMIFRLFIGAMFGVRGNKGNDPWMGDDPYYGRQTRSPYSS